MAVSFSKPWFEQVADVSTRVEFQNCVVRIVDPKQVLFPGPTYPADPEDVQPDEDLGDVVSGPGFDWETGLELVPVTDGVVFEGQARFIPVRAGIFHGGESQLNATVVRSMRLQLPKDVLGRVGKGFVVLFVEAVGNPALVGRSGTVSDDFQGSSSASRTLNVFFDSDVVV